jgi:hypothetical protein
MAIDWRWSAFVGGVKVAVEEKPGFSTAYAASCRGGQREEMKKKPVQGRILHLIML